MFCVWWLFKTRQTTDWLKALTTGNPVYLISNKGARWLWPVSIGCLLFRGTRSYLRICRGPVLPYTRFCICLLDYDYVLHIDNFVILYSQLDEKQDKKPFFKSIKWLIIIHTVHVPPSNTVHVPPSKLLLLFESGGGGGCVYQNIVLFRVLPY
jgi:hypothetical protein